MALIKCPECNKEISDKAEVCIHCGYPILKSNNKTGHNFYKISITNLCENVPRAIAITDGILNINIKDVIKLVERPTPNSIIFGLKYEDAVLVKQEFNDHDIEVVIEEDYESKTQTVINTDAKGRISIQNYNSLRPSSNYTNQPKCPMCGSTDISKISTLNRSASIMGLGILSKKIGKQWQCNNPKCKHLW